MAITDNITVKDRFNDPDKHSEEVGFEQEVIAEPVGKAFSVSSTARANPDPTRETPGLNGILSDAMSK